MTQQQETVNKLVIFVSSNSFIKRKIVEFKKLNRTNKEIGKEEAVRCLQPDLDNP